MSLCQGSPYANRRGRHAVYLHGALVAVEARKRLSIKHVELDPVDAGVVGAGVSCAMVCIGHFCPDFMAIIDFRDDLHDLSLFLGRCVPRNVTELFAVCGDDVEPCRVLWDFGVLLKVEDGSWSKRFALNFRLVWVFRPFGILEFLSPKVSVSSWLYTHEGRFAR